MNYDQKTKLLTATLGEWNLEKLMLRATQIFPDAKSLANGSSKNKGPTARRATRNLPNGRSRGRGGRKGKGRGKGKGGKKNYHAEVDDYDYDEEGEELSQAREQDHDQFLAEMSSQSEDEYEEAEDYDEEQDDEDDAEINHQEVDEEDEDDDGELEEDMDDEAKHLYLQTKSESDILMTKAKKLRAGAEKLRGFYKHGVSNNDRKKGTKPFKNKSACSKCGQRGHWHKDKDSNGKPLCPQADKPWPKGKARRNKPGKKKKMKKSRSGVGRLRVDANMVENCVRSAD